MCSQKNKTFKLLFKSHYFYVGSELSLNSSLLKPINSDAGDLLVFSYVVFSSDNGYFIKIVKQNFICCRCIFLIASWEKMFNFPGVKRT